MPIHNQAPGAMPEKKVPLRTKLIFGAGGAADNVLYNGMNSLILLIFNVGHMAAYRDIMKLNLPTECPGPSPSRLERLDYRHITRPIYPLDLNTIYP